MRHRQIFKGQHYRGRGRAVRRVDDITDDVDLELSIKERGVTYTVISVNPFSTGGKRVGQVCRCTLSCFAEWAQDFAPRPGEQEL